MARFSDLHGGFLTDNEIPVKDGISRDQFCRRVDLVLCRFAGRLGSVVDTFKLDALELFESEVPERFEDYAPVSQADPEDVKAIGEKLKNVLG